MTCKIIQNQSFDIWQFGKIDALENSIIQDKSKRISSEILFLATLLQNGGHANVQSKRILYCMHCSLFQKDTQLHQKIPASHLLPAVLYSLKSLLHNVVEYFFSIDKLNICMFF